MRAWMVAAVAVLVTAISGPAARAQTSMTEPLTLAVHPYLTPDDIHARFTPLAAVIARTLGHPVTVRVGGSYAEHINAIGYDQVDVAFMGPASYVTMLDRFGSKPLLARFEVGHRPDLYGVIVVAQGSDLRTVADLRGRSFAFGDRESTMGYYAPAWLMLHNGISLRALGSYRFLGTHPNVALAVLAGDYDAGAIKREVYDDYASRGLRILTELPPTPDHVFVTRANFPPADVAKLRGALLALGKTAEGRQVLLALHPGLTNLIPATEADYQELRQMVHTVGAAQ
jgi:phosphonate transport system substrate-binding protein